MKYPYQNKQFAQGLRWFGLLTILSLALAACAPATPVPTDTPVPSSTLANTDTPAAVATNTAAAMPAATDTPAATLDATSAAATAAAGSGGATASAASGVTVNIGSNATLGNFLVDGAGKTIYKYATDSANTSTCSASCLVIWPPLLATGAVTAGTGLDGTQFGTAQTTDGKMMVTYKGAPLYYYTNDTKPSDTNGNNVGGVWSVVAP